MSEEKELLAHILRQEDETQFTAFSNENALEVGLAILKEAQEGNKAVTIDITLNGQQLFHYAMSGTAADNDEWIRRKNRVAYRFGHSSLYIGTLLKESGKTIEERFLISSQEYAPFGGAFPLIIRGVGPVGTITASGLTQREDHELIVSALQKYLNLHTARNPDEAQYTVK